jgi:hypothetical protein
MNKVIFAEGLSKIENTFSSVNGEARYDKNMKTAIFNATQKWRNSTWEKVIEFLIYSFKPEYGIKLPVPADFRKTYGDIPVDSDYVPIKEQYNGEYATPEEIAAIFRPIMKKLTGGKDFRLRSSHIDGKFACEVCFREGCDGTTIERMRTGCAGYLSEEMAKVKAEMYREDRKFITEACGLVR